MVKCDGGKKKTLNLNKPTCGKILQYNGYIITIDMVGFI